MSSVAERIEDPNACCVVHIGRGERITGLLGELLNPSQFGELSRIPSARELRCRTSIITITTNIGCSRRGLPKVTLRLPTGVTKIVQLEPGDMVACVRGVEHTLWADHELVYFQFCSVLEGATSAVGI